MLILELGGIEIAVKDGDLLGRSGVGKEHLSGYDVVSRLHARFFLRGGQWYVEDNGSTNGTYLNGRRIAGPEPLYQGDEIRLGTEAALRVKRATPHLPIR